MNGQDIYGIPLWLGAFGIVAFSLTVIGLFLVILFPRSKTRIKIPGMEIEHDNLGLGSIKPSDRDNKAVPLDFEKEPDAK